MVAVDPFIIPIPKKFLRDKEDREFFERLIRTIDQIRVRTGGGVDIISNTEKDAIYDSASALAGESYKAMEDSYSSVFPLVSFNPITAARSITASPYDFVNAKNSSTITLPTEGIVIVRNGDGSSIKISSEKKINGFNGGVLRKKGTSIQFYYFNDDDEWFAI